MVFPTKSCHHLLRTGLQEHQRVLSAQEMLNTQVLPCSKRQAKVSSGCQLNLEGVPETALKKMAGNGMNVAAIGSVLLCCAMSLQKVKWLQQLHILGLSLIRSCLGSFPSAIWPIDFQADPDHQFSVFNSHVRGLTKMRSTEQRVSYPVCLQHNCKPLHNQDKSIW